MLDFKKFFEFVKLHSVFLLQLEYNRLIVCYHGFNQKAEKSSYHNLHSLFYILFFKIH